jgi:hypothetical protein
MQPLARLIIHVAFASLLIGTVAASAQVKPDLAPSELYWRPSTFVSANAHSSPGRSRAGNKLPTHR